MTHGIYLNMTRPRRLTQVACPDYDYRTCVCLASTTQLSPGLKQRMNYCTTDDYDNCPIYLCKALRTSTPHGLDREDLVDSGK